MRFPHLAHRSAAAHKLHSTPQQYRMILISGSDQTTAGYRDPLAYSSPEAVQTTGTVALHHFLTKINIKIDNAACYLYSVNNTFGYLPSQVLG